MDDGWRLGHRPGLDQLRVVAVAGVLWAHAGFGTYTGAMGVTLFFTLSGFLITRLMLEERDRTGTISRYGFYLRRARRLLPALAPALVFGALVNAHLGLPVLAPVLAGVTYTTNYAYVGDPDAFGGLAHLWTLAVEEHFYLVWPWVVAAASRSQLLRWAAVGVVAATALRWLAWETDPTSAYRLTHLRADAMLVGAIGAVLVARWGRPPRRLVAGAWAALGWLAFVDSSTGVHRLGFTAAAVAGLVVVVDGLHWRRRPAVEHLGRISYGIYLFHAPVGVLLHGRVSPWVALVAITVVGVGAAEVSWRWWESRFKAQGRRTIQAMPRRKSRADESPLTTMTSR